MCGRFTYDFVSAKAIANNEKMDQQVSMDSKMADTSIVALNCNLSMFQ